VVWCQTSGSRTPTAPALSAIAPAGSGGAPAGSGPGSYNPLFSDGDPNSAAHRYFNVYLALTRHHTREQYYPLAVRAPERLARAIYLYVQSRVLSSRAAAAAAASASASASASAAASGGEAAPALPRPVEVSHVSHAQPDEAELSQIRPEHKSDAVVDIAPATTATNASAPASAAGESDRTKLLVTDISSAEP
jgi:hypothetical protein